MPDLLLTALRALASLSVTLGLIVIVGYLWRRYGSHVSHRLTLAPGPKPRRRLNILESQRLSPTTTLHLIKLDDTELLISSTNAQTTLIHTPTQPKSAKLKS